jgi:hypothetical protein
MEANRRLGSNNWGPTNERFAHGAPGNEILLQVHGARTAATLVRSALRPTRVESGSVCYAKSAPRHDRGRARQSLVGVQVEEQILNTVKSVKIIVTVCSLLMRGFRVPIPRSRCSRSCWRKNPDVFYSGRTGQMRCSGTGRL